MQAPSIHIQALKALLIPISILSLLLCLGLSYLFIEQAKTHQLQHGSAQLQLWSNIANRFNTRTELQQLLDNAREEADIKALLIRSASGEILLHAGPIRELETLPDALGHIPMQASEDRRDVFSVKLNNGDNFFLQLDPMSQQLLSSQMLLLAMTLWIVIGALTVWLTSRCSRDISHSLSALRRSLQQIRDGDLEEQPHIQHSSRELQELQAALDSMRISLLEDQAEVQRHIEQSTEDLRETLETIEVQNIELDMARKKALEASRVKSEFLANTSHEVRTPLNGIIGFAQLALRSDLSPQQHTYLRTILDSAQELLARINDILDFSKLESGQLTLDHIPLNIRHCVDETLQILAPEAEQKAIELVSLLDSELPAQLLGDPQRLKQVLSNLLNNSIKFSEKCNVVVRVQLLGRSDNQVELKISVSDSGIGLSREQQQELFAPFTQADSSNAREHGGTGLGLTISKGLVERMGGSIGVESELGKGSTFWITLTLGIDTKAGETSQPPLLSNNKILIGSCNSMVSLQLSDLLEHWGGNVTTVTEFNRLLPEIAEANRSSEPFELLLIDTGLQMDEADYQLLKKVIWQANQRYRCQIGVITSGGQHDMIIDETLAPIIHFIDKPIHADNLLQLCCQRLQICDLSDHREIEKPQDLRRSASVLVVDDNPANLQLASELLKGIGVEVITANNGAEALRQCDQQSFDLIFMDVQMPVMDGSETTRQLRQREAEKSPHSRTPVIALTAHAMSDQKTEVLLAGMDDYLHKPVSESQLIHTIKRWCPSARAPISSITNPPLRTQSTQPEQSKINELVDRNECLRLANHKADLARDMLANVIESARRDQSLIRSHYTDGNIEQLSSVIHKLYGSSCYSGVPQLRKICGALDKKIQAGENSGLEQSLAELERAIEALLSWSDEYDLDVLFGLDDEANTPKTTAQ